MELGDRVRERRQQLGLSLRDLAERSELTASFLSQVERGVTSPSIDSLRRVANALDVPVFHFLLEPDRESPVVREQPAHPPHLARFPDRLSAIDAEAQPQDGGLPHRA